MTNSQPGDYAGLAAGSAGSACCSRMLAAIAYGASVILALFAVGRDRGAARWRWVILATALAAFLGGLALQKSKHAQFVTIAQNTPHMAAKFGPRRLTVEQQREMLAALLPFAGTVIGL